MSDILDRYPNVRLAVSFVELIMCGTTPDDPESTWDMLISAGYTADKMLAGIKWVMEDEVNDPIGFPSDKIAAARAQLDHPEFRTYLAGKLGLT